MTTLYLIIAIVALTALLIGSVVLFFKQRGKHSEALKAKQTEVDTLNQEIAGQQEEIRKRDEMIETLQEIEIEHLKKSKKLRTPDSRLNVRNASSIMQDLAGNGDSNKDSPAS